jgi:hypothetical protein
MLKRIFAVVLALLIVFPILIYNTLDAKACNGSYYSGYPDFNCHTLNGGVGNYGYTNRYYWVDSTASGYSTRIQDAVNSWIYTSATVGVSTPISILKTTTKSNGTFEVHYNAISGTISPGACYQYTYQTQIDPNSSNWGWAKVILNSNTFYSLLATEQQASIAHEFGHAMGLNHTLEILGAYPPNDPNRIMTPSDMGRTTIIPTAGDLQVINHLYA